MRRSLFVEEVILIVETYNIAPHGLAMAVRLGDLYVSGGGDYSFDLAAVCCLLVGKLHEEDEFTTLTNARDWINTEHPEITIYNDDLRLDHLEVEVLRAAGWGLGRAETLLFPYLLLQADQADQADREGLESLSLAKRLVADADRLAASCCVARDLGWENDQLLFEQSAAFLAEFKGGMP